MDTVLNLGMNDDVVEGLATKTDNPRFAWDSYRRFLEMFGNVVLEIPRSLFEDELDDIKYEKGIEEDSDLSAEDLKELVGRFKNVYESMDITFPQDVWKQLELASKWLIFECWFVSWFGVISTLDRVV
jgi:pyruvate, orthophosphate dikinase